MCAYCPYIHEPLGGQGEFHSNAILGWLPFGLGLVVEDKLLNFHEAYFDWPHLSLAPRVYNREGRESI
jgi:hypothetical protein